MKKFIISEKDTDENIVIKSNYLKANKAGGDTSVKNRYGENIYDFIGSQNIRKIFKTINVKPGLALMLSNFSSEKNMTMKFEVKNAPLQFGFCLKGKNLHTINGLEKSEKIFSTEAGILNTFYTPDISGDSVMPANEDHMMVGLHIDPELFFSMLGNEINNIPESFRKISDNTGTEKIACQETMTPAMQSIAFQIINCPYNGVIQNLFFESKAIELLLLKIESLVRSGKKVTDSCHLIKSDIERIYAARDLLLSDIQNPPTIAKLSQQAGINEFKLKSGFRRLFDTTIFAYLHQYKMEKAKVILEEGFMNVNETAWDVGYTNVSHFIAAYRKNYGVNPGCMLKATRVR